ncbi:MAG: glycosyltransferase family 9 protein [Verrucomicrobiota bacterium]
MNDSHQERILIIRFKSIGDVLHTLPAVNAVRKNRPNAHITFLVCKSIAPLLEGFASVDEVMAIDRPAVKKFWPAVPVLVSLLSLIRSKRFTHVIDFQGYGETAWITRFSRAKERWGSVYKDSRSRFYTRPVLRKLDRHTIDWNLTLLRECGLREDSPDNRFVLPNRYRQQAAALFNECGLYPDRHTVMIQPFTSSVRKDWPFERFLTVADQLRSRGVQVAFCGGPSDRLRLENARSKAYPVFAGHSLLVTAGLLSLSRMVLGGDTGILHLAVALELRVLMVLNRSADTPGCSIPYRHRDWTIDPLPGGDLSTISTESVLDRCLTGLDLQAENPSSSEKLLTAT